MDPVLVGAHLTIDLGALQENYKLLAEKASPAVCAASVKANAYGLGIEKIAPALAAAGCLHFFVALPSEGITLRKILPEAKIYVLGGLLKKAEKYYQEYNLVPVLNHLEEIELWSQFAKEHGRLPAVIHVDTGITRLGLLEKEIRALAVNPSLLDNLDIEYVMSHLACGDDRTHPHHERPMYLPHAAMSQTGRRRAAHTLNDRQPCDFLHVERTQTNGWRHVQ